MKKILIILCVFFFVNLATAYTLIDQNVIYENNPGKLNVFPAIAQPITPNGNIFEQTFIAEKKVAGTHNLRLAYIFNEQLEYGKIWQLINGEWIDRTSLITHTTQNGKHIYFTPEIEFSDATPIYTWKINYTPAENDLSKKWELYAWNEDINILLDPWWNPNWDYNQTISITTTTSALDQNFTAIINLDTSTLISAGKMQSDCDDLRIIYQDTTDLNRNIIGCNQIDTNVFFKLQNTIQVSTIDTNYSLYYGNSVTSNPPDNNKFVYRIAEDFSNLDDWEHSWNTGLTTLQDGKLQLASNGGTEFGGYCWKGNGNKFKNFNLQLDMNGTISATQTSHILLDYNGSTTPASSHPLHYSNDYQYTQTQVISYEFLTPPASIELFNRSAGISWNNSDWNHLIFEYNGDQNEVTYKQGDLLVGTGTGIDSPNRPNGTICFLVHTASGNNIFIKNVQLRETVGIMPTITLQGEQQGIYLSVQYFDLFSGDGIKPDSWVIKGTDYISFCDSNGLCFIADLNDFTTEEYVITATKSGADTNTLTATFGRTQKHISVGNLTLRRTTIVLVNENNGDYLTTADFNGDGDKHIKKVVLYDINGTFIFDFNDSATTNYEIILTDDESAYNIEITYDNAGLDVVYKKEFNFNLIYDVNTRICIAPLQTFYEQIFTSVQERQIIVYLPTSDCYALAASLRNIFQEGQFNNVFTINKTYQAFTFDSSGIKTFLAWVNGGSEYSHNLDAIEFNKEAVEIIAGYDTLAFVPLLNSITGDYDTNILQIYYKSYFGDYVSSNLKIFNGDALLFELTEDVNANEFVVNWDWGAYALTDQNMLTIIVVGTKADGAVESVTEYFTVSGDEFVGNRDPTFIAAMVLLFFLFGITVTSIGKTFGWIGIIVCIISMGISVMALPGMYWVQMLQAGIFICFLYIILNGGGTTSISRGLTQ